MTTANYYRDQFYDRCHFSCKCSRSLRLKNKDMLPILSYSYRIYLTESSFIANKKSLETLIEFIFLISENSFPFRIDVHPRWRFEATPRGGHILHVDGHQFYQYGVGNVRRWMCRYYRSLG